MPLNLSGLGGGGGGGGLPHLGNIDVGSLVQAATMPPGIQFLQGLATLPDAFNKARFDASQAQEERLKSKGLEMQIAQNQWDQTVSMIQKNPDLAGSAPVINKMHGLSAQTGYALPMTKDGRIDTSVWGADFNEFMKDKDFQERWWAASPKQRHAMADAMHLAGVSDEAFNSEPVLTAGEQVLQGKLKVSVDNQRRLDNLAESQIGLNTAKAQGIRANITLQQDKLAQSRKVLNEKIWEVKYKTAAMERIASKGNLTKLDIAQINALQREITGANRDATTAMDDVDKTLGAAYDAGVDESTLTGIQSDRDNFEKTLGTAQTQSQAFRETLQPRIDTSQGRAVTQQSGRQATVTNVHANTSMMTPGTYHGRRVFQDPATQQLYNPDGSPFTP